MLFEYRIIYLKLIFDFTMSIKLKLYFYSQCLGILKKIHDTNFSTATVSHKKGKITKNITINTVHRNVSI